MGAEVDVVVVAYQSADDIRNVVTTASRLGAVFVVDHGRDGAGTIAESSGAVAVADPMNPGFGAGQNRGVALGHAPYVLLLNPDAMVDVDAVRRGVELMDAAPDVGATQGRIDGRAGPERSAGRALGPAHLLGRALGAKRLMGLGVVRWLMRRFRLLRDHVERVPTAEADVESLAATAVLVRRSAFAAVGGFDEGYFLYGEDLDLCRRLRRAGYRLVALPERWATHVGGASSATSFDRELEWWRGTLRYAALWWRWPAFVAGLLAAVLEAIRLSVRHPAQWRSAWSPLVMAPIRARAPKNGATQVVERRER